MNFVDYIPEPLLLPLAIILGTIIFGTLGFILLSSIIEEAKSYTELFPKKWKPLVFLVGIAFLLLLVYAGLAPISPFQLGQNY